MDGKLTPDPLFIGLTRPTMIFGVSITYALLNMVISTMYFINTTNFYVVPLAVIIHMIGYIMCFKEPLFMELYLKKLAYCNKCYNKGYYGANSYYV